MFEREGEDVESLWTDWNQSANSLLNTGIDRCLLELTPGAGGRDAADVARQLTRMYVRWLDAHGWKYHLDIEHNDDGGVNNATITINHPHAWGLLQHESGPHRMSHQSRYGKTGKRQTSFVGVSVLPLIETTSYVINADDLDVTTFAGSSKGGQHANKASTNVRIRHIPSGLRAQSCGRSLKTNRDTATAILAARVHAWAADDDDAVRGGTGFGSRRRSYVEMPQSRVADHLTGWKTNYDGTLDGNIDELLWRAVIQQIAQERAKLSASQTA